MSIIIIKAITWLQKLWNWKAFTNSMSSSENMLMNSHIQFCQSSSCL